MLEREKEVEKLFACPFRLDLSTKSSCKLIFRSLVLYDSFKLNNGLPCK